jgi:mono/diheme cytochrome c family protein
MRSVVCLKPNEQRTCVGCHEPRTHAPPNLLASAFDRPPSRPQPPPWGTQTISFMRDVQPLINKQCAPCHTHDRAANGVILTDDLSDQFTIAYEELLPYLSVANSKRWDHPEDVYARPPYTYGSNASRLTKLLLTGHHGVSLSGEEWERLVTWIDANGVYYDRYETEPGDRHIFTGRVREDMATVYAHRCARCHGAKHDGRHGTWWLSLNRGDVRSSRALAAPLAGAAGGSQRCSEIVFADTNDPDYQRLLTALTAVQEMLSKQPRADLLSVRVTAEGVPSP